jgi:hypothetical protein
MRKVIYHLEPALPQVKKMFPTINWGGCGVFANLLATELDKLGVKYKIIWIGHEARHKKDIKKIFKHYGGQVTLGAFNDSDIYVAHIMIKVGRKFIDASGVHKNLNNTQWGWYGLRHEITKEQLELISLSSEGWNSDFNRNQIPRVKKEVKKIFEKVVI